jgi:hypothetical protein
MDCSTWDVLLLHVWYSVDLASGDGGIVVAGVLEGRAGVGNCD